MGCPGVTGHKKHDPALYGVGDDDDLDFLSTDCFHIIVVVNDGV